MTNESYFNPLHLASLNGHAKVIKELLKHRVDVSLETKHGENALDFATRNGHLDQTDKMTFLSRLFFEVCDGDLIQNKQNSQMKFKKKPIFFS